MKPEEINIINILNGYLKSQTLLAIVKLEIPRQIPVGGEYRSIFDIARQIEVNPEYLCRAVRALTTLNIFEEDVDRPGWFKHTPTSECLLQQGVQDTVKFISHPVFFDNWQNLDETIREGKSCAFKKHKDVNSPWEMFEKDPSYKQLFENAMGYFSQSSLPIVAGTDFSQFKQVVDLGGCTGDVLLEILKKNPHLKGINFDMPNVIESTSKLDRSNIDKQVLERFSETSGSFLESVPKSDCYIMKSVLHNWSDENSCKILENISKSIEPNGKVIVFDMILKYSKEEERSLSTDSPLAGVSAPFVDLNMMHMLGGKERTENDWNQLAEKCGFKVEKIEPTAQFNYSRIILSKVC
eukprot:gene2593-3213_t